MDSGVHPRLFISYAWTSPEHESWVLEFASELRRKGVDVVLDKWDLKPGHDANVFMERMVNDPDVKKVVLLCNRTYAEKANDREGGVGTETQIISPEVYGKVDQEKFVAVIVERDQDGHRFLPTYYKGKVYIDLSDEEVYATNFDQLLKWIYDKPINPKPPLGEVPEFVSEHTNVPTMETRHYYERAREALKGAKGHAPVVLDDFFNAFVEGMAGFRIVDDDTEFDQKVNESIDAFLPFRNQAIEVFRAMAQYPDKPEMTRRLHRFFERLIPFCYDSRTTRFKSDWEADNMKFIVNELYLYALASLVKYEEFGALSEFLGEEFYVGEEFIDSDKAMLPRYLLSFPVLRSLHRRNERLKLSRLSLHADWLNERSSTTGFDFVEIMQADFLNLMRDYAEALGQGRWRVWRAETLVYACNRHKPFEVFARSQSAQYFERLKPVLAIEGKDDLVGIIEAVRFQKLPLPQWQFESIDIGTLCGIKDLATKP